MYDDSRDCVHRWSEEFGVRIRNYPHMLSICTWCGQTRLRLVNPIKFGAQQRREAA